MNLLASKKFQILKPGNMKSHNYQKYFTNYSEILKDNIRVSWIWIKESNGNFILQIDITKDL